MHFYAKWGGELALRVVKGSKVKGKWLIGVGDSLYIVCI
jgi:hypothetical protein